MPVIQPDTSEALDMSPIEPGTYKAKVTEVKTQNSKGSGGKQSVPMIVPKFNVTVDGKDRARISYLVIQGPGSGGFDQLLRACHMDELADQYKDPGQPNPPFDTDTLINQELNVVIDTQLYQKLDGSGNPVGEGEKRDYIKTFLRA